MRALEGKRVLVSGAASGIGRAASRLFARQGALVGLADRNVPGGQAAAAEIAQEDGEAVFFPCDVTSGTDCRRAVDGMVGELGGLDILFNNAGIIMRHSLLETGEDEWDLMMNVHVKSVFLMTRCAVPAMQAGGGGSIINMASGWGLVGGPKAAAYCAAKGAVVQLTKAMAIDFGPMNIRVNCLCPGDTDTPLLREEARQLAIPEALFLEQSARRPLGRIGTPDEIAEAALFLASDASRFMTGAVLVVDGGGLAGG